MEFKKNIFYYLNVTFFILWSVYMLFTKMILSGVDTKLILVLVAVVALLVGMVVAYDKLKDLPFFEEKPIVKIGMEVVFVAVFAGVSMIICKNNAYTEVAMYQNIAVLVCMLLSYGIARFFSSFAVFSMGVMIFWPTLMSKYQFPLEAIMKVLAIYAAVFVVAMIFFLFRDAHQIQSVGTVMYIIGVILVIVTGGMMAGTPFKGQELLKVFLDFEHSFSFEGYEKFYYLSCLCAAMLGAVRMWCDRGNYNNLVIFVLNAMLIVITGYGVGSEYTYIMVPFLAVVATSIFGIAEDEESANEDFVKKAVPVAMMAKTIGDDMPDIITEKNFRDFVRENDSDTTGFVYSDSMLGDEPFPKGEYSSIEHLKEERRAKEVGASGSSIFTQAPGEGVSESHAVVSGKKSNIFEYSDGEENKKSKKKEKESSPIQETTTNVLEEATVQKNQVEEPVVEESDEELFALLSEDPKEETDVVEEALPEDELLFIRGEETVEPLEETVETVEEEAEPLEEIAEAVEEEAEPLEEIGGTIAEEAEPLEEIAEAVAEDVEPLEEIAEAVEEEAEMLEETVETDEEETEPSEEITEEDEVVVAASEEENQQFEEAIELDDINIEIDENIEFVDEEAIEPVIEEVVEEAIEPVAEEVVEEAIEPEVEEVVEEAIEPVVEEVVEEANEPVAEEVVEEAIEPEVEEVVEEAIEPVVEDVVEEAIEPETEEVVEEANEPEVEEIVEEAIEPEVEEVVEEAIEPEAEEVAEEAIEPEAEEVAEEAIEPEAEEVAEEAIEPEVEKVVEEASEPIVEEVAEEASEPIVEEVVEEASEPIVEEVVEEATEPVSLQENSEEKDFPSFDGFGSDELDLSVDSEEIILKKQPVVEEVEVPKRVELDPKAEAERLRKAQLARKYLEEDLEDEFPSFEDTFGLENLGDKEEQSTKPNYTAENPVEVVAEEKQSSLFTIEEPVVEEAAVTADSVYQFEEMPPEPEINAVTGGEVFETPVFEIPEETKPVVEEKTESIPTPKPKKNYFEDDEDDFDYPSFDNMFGTDGLDLTLQPKVEEEKVDIDEVFPSFDSGTMPVDSALGDPYFDWSKIDAEEFLKDGEKVEVAETQVKPIETNNQEFVWTPEMIAALENEK